MKNIGFIGLGIMGKPMVHNLLKAGFSVTVFDVVTDAVNLMTAEGLRRHIPQKKPLWAQIWSSRWFRVVRSSVAFSAVRMVYSQVQQRER